MAICPDTHNAACGIETCLPKVLGEIFFYGLDTHNAACGIETKTRRRTNLHIIRLDTHNAACGIETFSPFLFVINLISPDTHNAACGIETPNDNYEREKHCEVPTHTMLRAALKLV